MNAKLEAIRAHEAIWRKLHALVVEVLREFCEQGMLKERDYFVVEDDLGWILWRPSSFSLLCGRGSREGFSFFWLIFRIGGLPCK